MSTLSAREFFEEHLPQALENFSEPDAEGTLAFAIDGAGEWTVDLALRTVSKGFDTKADFTLRMPADDFAAMVSGEFDAEAAVNAGRMQAKGNVKLLAAFSLLLGPLSEEEPV